MSVYLLRYVIFLTICFYIVTHAFAVVPETATVDDVSGIWYNTDAGRWSGSLPGSAPAVVLYLFCGGG